MSIGRKPSKNAKTSATLIATITGLWLGFAGTVTASAESESVPVQTSTPSAEDCIAAASDGDSEVIDSWARLMADYSYRKSITLDEFKTGMDSLLTSPELINCRTVGGHTVAHFAAIISSVEGAKWAVSKGVDLTLENEDPNLSENTAHGLAGVGVYQLNNGVNWLGLTWSKDRQERATQVAKILVGPATKSCAEVDGQTPPANEYCIVAENSQASRRIKLTNDLQRRFAGWSDYRYETDKPLSGTGLYPGWKSTITFTCSSAASQGCGYKDYDIHESTDPILINFIKSKYGIGVSCGESGDLLDLDRDLEPGESISVTQSSDTERSSPFYLTCRGWAVDPFTVSIRTTRLAQ